MGGMAIAAATKLFTRESIGISWCGSLPFVGHAPVAQGDRDKCLVARCHVGFINVKIS
jgi:hypothetical protein